MAGVTADLSYGLRDAIEKKINKLPLSYFHRVSQGDVLSRITNDVDTLTNSLNQSVTQMITSVCTLIGVLIMMLTISWQLTLVALCIVPVSLVFVMVIVKFSQKHFKAQQYYLGSVNGQVEEMYGGHLVVKAFGREKETVAAFDAENQKLYNAGWKSQFLSGLMQPVMNFVGNLGYVVICMVGASMAAGGSMTIGGIQAFVQYVRSFTQPITQMANISNQLQMTVAAAERIFQFLDKEEEAGEEPKLRTADLDIQGNIVFDHVKFGYEDSEGLVIRDFSATVKAGQKVAIVGPHRRGQDHHGEAAHALPRLEGRANHLGRPPHHRLLPHGPAQPVRHGAPGRLAVQRHHFGEHPLRQAHRHRRGGGAGRQDGPGRPLYPHLARGLPDGAQ